MTRYGFASRVSSRAVIEVEKSAFITREYKVTRVAAVSSGLLDIVLILRRRKGIHLEVSSIYFEAKYVKFEYVLREV
jgi:hypothetical protein